MANDTNNNKPSNSFTNKTVSDSIMSPTAKYDYPQQLDGIQTNPKTMKTVNFKQDYVVLIRKKKYYAATAQKGGDENYLRVYQVNNFLSIRTSHNTSGRPATCSISIKGAERVICAEQGEENTKQWSNWKSLLEGWLNIDDEGSNNGYYWRVGGSTYKTSGEAVDYKNLIKAREAKYGWKFAEKCDWEPMDEIYIFSKSRTIRKGPGNTGEYQFLPIFFGYLDSVQKTYQAGKGGLLINISASDHLKLLDLSKVVNYPSIAPGIYAGNGIDIRYPTDSLGCYIINDPFVNSQTSGNSPNKDSSVIAYVGLDNVFGGKYPYEIITQLATDAGIPRQYLDTRIEKIKSIPFLPKTRQMSNGDLFNADLKSRLRVCQEASQKLFLEFFADEAGNIVLKIPNFALGANQLQANNMGLDFGENVLDNVGSKLVISTEALDWLDANKTGGSAGYVASQQARYDQAIRTGDIDMVRRLEQDALEIGYTLVKHGSLPNAVQAINETVEYIVNDGDTLSGIAEKILGDANLYHVIHNDNYDTIGPDPNFIYVGQKLIINKQTTNRTQQTVTNVQAQISNKTAKIVKGRSLSEKTDQYIPEIKPEYIVSFTLTDTDKEIYNMYEIQAESVEDLYNNGITVIRRAVPDLDSIIRFGLRPHPGVVNTPLITNEIEAQIFGVLMLNTSLANRYTGSLTMIEDSAIRVGDPVRFHIYDEHPMKETGIFNKKEFDGQAVFYVTGIERSISPNNVSHMTLQLKAGRMMGQESVFDISYLLYKYYYDEKMAIDLTKHLDEFVKYYTSEKTIPYTWKAEDTIQKVINRTYGRDTTGEKFEEIIYAIISLNPNIFNQKDIARPETINELMQTDMTLILPKKEYLRK